MDLVDLTIAVPEAPRLHAMALEVVLGEEPQRGLAGRGDHATHVRDAVARAHVIEQGSDECRSDAAAAALPATKKLRTLPLCRTVCFPSRRKLILPQRSGANAPITSTSVPSLPGPSMAERCSSVPVRHALAVNASGCSLSARWRK